jgi:undecaprenyl-diphosphatase
MERPRPSAVSDRTRPARRLSGSSPRRRFEWEPEVALLRRLAGPLRSSRAKVAATVTPLGDDLKPWLMVTPLLIAAGQRGRRAMFSGWEAVALGAALAEVVSHTARRARPDETALRDRSTVGDLPSSSSFPSTHTTSAVAFASATGFRYPPSAAVLAPMAALVAWSRAAGGRHYPTDVVGGTVLGGAAALIVLALDRRLPPLLRHLRSH